MRIVDFSFGRISLTPDQQLELAQRPEQRLQRALASCEGLDLDASVHLARHGDSEVLRVLLRNADASRYDEVHLVVAERILRREDACMDIRVDDVSEAGQLFMIENGSELKPLLALSPYSRVHELAVSMLSLAARRHLAGHNPHLSGELRWQHFDAASCGGSALSDGLKNWDLSMMPSRIADAIYHDAPRAACVEMVGNETWELNTSRLVGALLLAPRGRDHLERCAPQDRSVWDALLPTWSGTLEQLLVTCTELGPDEG